MREDRTTPLPGPPLLARVLAGPAHPAVASAARRGQIAPGWHAFKRKGASERIRLGRLGVARAVAADGARIDAWGWAIPARAQIVAGYRAAPRRRSSHGTLGIILSQGCFLFARSSVALLTMPSAGVKVHCVIPGAVPNKAFVHSGGLFRIKKPEL